MNQGKGKNGKGKSGSSKKEKQNKRTGLSEEDKKLNDHTFLNQDGGRLHSSYENAYEGKTIWIMTSGFGNDSTDPNMCHTCIMYPNEY